MATKEQKEKDARVNGLLDELRVIQRARESLPGGMPAVGLPLDKIYTFKLDNGEMCAVMPLREIVYIVDGILRSVD